MLKTGLRRRRAMTVALVGADGAGKSTMTQALQSLQLPAPVKTIYMGVNLEASSLMLPTTRLLLVAKRMRGSRPDLVASSLQAERREGAGVAGAGMGKGAKNALRLTVWIAEEWLRQAVTVAYQAFGYIVVFDRHFIADYYFADGGSGQTGGLPARLHGWMLRNVYPKPDLVICLDAPAEVLYLRKPESSVEWLEQRRRQYLRLADVVPTFVVVDVDQPFAHVQAEVVEHIRTHWKARSK